MSKIGIREILTTIEDAGLGYKHKPFGGYGFESFGPVGDTPLERELNSILNDIEITDGKFALGKFNPVGRGPEPIQTVRRGLTCLGSYYSKRDNNFYYFWRNNNGNIIIFSPIDGDYRYSLLLICDLTEEGCKDESSWRVFDYNEYKKMVKNK